MERGADPGYAATNLQLAGPTGWLRGPLAGANRVLAQDAAIGALSQLYAATAPQARGGQYIGPALARMRGHPAGSTPAAAARDPERARWLWELSEQLSGVRFSLG